MEVKVAFFNAVGHTCNQKSDFFEVKLVSYASLCIENYLPDKRHYNPRFVYFLPTFEVHLCTVTFGLMYG